MYLLFSVPAKCLFLWTGPETDIALEQGMLIPSDANPEQPAMVKLEKSFGRSQSYFLPLPEFVIRLIIRTQRMFSGILRGHQSIRSLAIPVVIWTSFLALFLYSSKQHDIQGLGEPEIKIDSGDLLPASQSAARSIAEVITQEISNAFAAGQPYSKLRTNQPGVTELTTVWPQRNLRQSYAVIPGYGSLSSGLALSTELPFTAIFVYLSSGRWEMRAPSKTCSGGFYYQMNILDKFALAFDEDRTQPGATFSLAQIPLNHSAIESCHSELMEHW
jgi:hypothetical protein